MLLIPGLTSGGAVWDGIVAAFADRYECHVFTLAGFAGQPPVVADSTWLVQMRDAIVRYARERGLERPVIVGHSLGGFLALDIAATVPELPRAVVNVDGLPFLGATADPAATVESIRPMADQMRRAILAPSTEATAQMQEAQLRSMVRDTTRLPMLRAMSRASDPATVAEAMFGLYTTDLRPRLERVTAPVLNVHAWVAYAAFGQTREGAERLFSAQYATLRNATTRVSDTAYHFIMLDEPMWLIGEMRRFLTSR
jgi:pimeloyl-ACP methyl ester carboxylesterase